MASNKFSWRYDSKTQDFKKVFIEASNIVGRAANAAVFDAALAGVRAGRQSIAGAGFSPRWQKALRFKMLTPKDSQKPVAYVHTAINYADVFEKGADIEGDPWIWLPLASVPRAPGSGIKFGGVSGREHMTPQQYVRSVGPLVLMWRPGKAPLLGARISRGTKAQPFGKFATKGQLKRGVKAGKRVETIPLFVGVKSTRIGKKWDVQGALAKAANNLPQFYEDELKKLDEKKILQG